MKLNHIIPFLLLICGLFSSTVSVAQELVDAQEQLVNEINALRKRRLMNPLEYRVKFQDQTDVWAEKISRRYVHNYKDVCAGEVINIVPDIDEIIAAFMASPGHKAVLMDRKVKGICVSVWLKPGSVTAIEGGTKFMVDTYHTVIRTYRN
ncbi:MAG: hypothetical protein WKF87_06835 [Chryseolinea sp.]